MTTHHLIFKDSETRRELWICYPIISCVERRQSSPVANTAPTTSHQLLQVNSPSDTSPHLTTLGPNQRQNPYTNSLTSDSPFTKEKPIDPVTLLSKPIIRLKCKDFVFVAFTFISDQVARDTFDTLTRLTCIHDIRQLYAFIYTPLSIERKFNGWSIYDPVAEFNRQGALDKASNWRITNVNSDYQFSPTYPALFLVPSTVSDTVLTHAAKFRSKARVPALSYFHKLNACSITRCSQPMVGLKQARSAQDEKIATEIFISNQCSSINRNGNEYPEKIPGITSKQDNLIVDARPTANAVAQKALGAGSESMENYKGARKVYLGIDNIHVMRDSLQKVVDALKEGDIASSPPSKDSLHRSNWLRYISTILTGAITVSEHVHFKFSHVIIHCSDGWDRTSQLSSIAQIILDPYYRTLEGFIILVEKEWLSFGHRFAERSGHLNSEKNFTEPSDSPFGGAQQMFKDVGSRFVKSGTSAVAALGGNRNNKAAESTSGYNGFSFPGGPGASSSAFGTEYSSSGSNMKYTAPVFHQFLDCVYQLVIQFPDRFEFGERFLRRLLYHTYSCQYGTFLFNSELERKQAKADECTRSVWDYFLSKKKEFINTSSTSSDENTESDESKGYNREREFGYPADKIVLQPNAKQLKYWSELFGRSSEEMNTRPKVDNRVTSNASDGLNNDYGQDSHDTSRISISQSLSGSIQLDSPSSEALATPVIPVKQVSAIIKDEGEGIVAEDDAKFADSISIASSDDLDPLSSQLVREKRFDVLMHNHNSSSRQRSENGSAGFPAVTLLSASAQPIGQNNASILITERHLDRKQELTKTLVDAKAYESEEKEEESAEQPLDPKLYARFNAMTTLDFDDGSVQRKPSASKFPKFGLF